MHCCFIYSTIHSIHSLSLLQQNNLRSRTYFYSSRYSLDKKQISGIKIRNEIAFKLVFPCFDGLFVLIIILFISLWVLSHLFIPWFVQFFSILFAWFIIIFAFYFHCILFHDRLLHCFHHEMKWEDGLFGLFHGYIMRWDTKCVCF